MKSTINSTSENTNKPYPKLMKSNLSGSIFLISRPNVGVCIHVGNHESPNLGSYSNEWTTPMQDWDGSVTLWS